jgi:hypothetical protein
MSSDNRPYNILQKMTAGTNATYSTQQVLVNSSPQEVAIELYIESIDSQEVTCLKPGQSYHVIVYTTGMRDDGSFVSILDKAELRLSCNNAYVSVEDPICEISNDSIEDFCHQFIVIVADDCTAGEINLELGIREKIKRFRKVNTLDVYVDSKIYHIDPELLKATVGLNQDLPSNAAILRVEIPDTDRYRLHGANKYARLEPTQPLQLPEVGVAQFIEKDQNPDAVIGRVNGFSRRGIPELKAWLKKITDKADETNTILDLIIADLTGNDFPWEMLKLDDGSWLGVKARIARWLPVYEGDGSFKCMNLHGDLHYTGEVIAYFDSEMSNIEYEQASLSLYRTTTYQDTPELIRRLSDRLNMVSMVYLACHGEFAHTDEYKIFLGSLDNPTKHIRLLQLENIEPVPSDKRPVFFVNACHSARLQKDAYGLYGLAEIVLSRFGDGYIGTLGPVGSEYAAQIAQQFIVLTQEYGLSPAEALRKIREKAAKLFQSDIHNQEYALNFLYTFMYVYFGDPLAQLQLIRVNEQVGTYE